MIKTISNRIAPVPVKALIAGGIGAAAFYICFLLIVFLGGNTTLVKMENALSSEVLPLEIDEPQEKASVASAQQEYRSDIFAKPDIENPENTLKPQDLEDAAAPPVAAKNALLPAPYDGLSEDSPYGLLPVIGGNKLTPFQAYKKPFKLDPAKPAIALVIKDFNAPNASYEDALKSLPDTVSVLISPYDEQADRRQKAARTFGHEVWMYVPFENKNFPLDDPGPRGVLSNVGLGYNQDNLLWILSRTSGYAGVAGYVDGAFDYAQPMLRGLYKNIFSRGLGFFQMNPDADGLGESGALSSAAAYAINTLPKDAQTRGLEDSFEALKQKARQSQYAVGILSVNPVLLQDAGRLIAEAEREGFQFVPLSAPADNRL